MESITQKKLQHQSPAAKKMDLHYLRTITQNFSEDQILGHGGYGIVYKGEQENGEVVAVKKLIMSMAGMDDKQFMNEVQHAMDICHPNIVRLEGYCYQTEKELTFYNGSHIFVDEVHRLLCFEYLPNGSLDNYITDESSGLEWHTRYNIIEGICTGLYCLHEGREGAPILHLDLKPTNILLDKNMTPKIADFGLSRLFDEGKTHTCTTHVTGSRGYMPPEYIDSFILSKESDIFSLSVIIVEIVTGHRKYPEGTSDEEFFQIYERWRVRLQKTSNKTSLEEKCRQVDQCIELGRKCMEKDRKRRTNIREIVEILKTIECSVRDDGSDGEEQNGKWIHVEWRETLDPELGQTSPSEHKQLKLAGSLTRGIIDRDLKPSSNERKFLQRIIKYPPTRAIQEDEEQLLWKFGFSLTSEKKALTKFVRSVDWTNIQEAKQAVDLIWTWETIDVADALELLSPDIKSDIVRSYAVRVLERADDEEIQWYLLQLVQALRFETSDKSDLAHFLVNRALSNIEIASFLRWYVVVELHDHAGDARRYYNTYDMLEDEMKKMVAREDGDEDGFRLWQSLSRQSELTYQLCSVMKDVNKTRGSTQKKVEKLRLMFDEPIRSPLAPTLLLTGVVPQESSVFKSALRPALCLTFKTGSGRESKIIFRKGDDLRQDQLVTQIISLMDRLLKTENMDLHITTYRVLATGQDEGMLEYISSSSVAQILSEHRSITSYLQKFHPDEHGPFGITAQCLETFIKSCAGCAVITYIMGVGNRHLDNLLLRDDGCVFHGDFSFIMGRDPNPYPLPVKLCKEMVEAMGGTESQYYNRFKSYCCEAYNILRNNSSVILNIFRLMERSDIPDISSEENGSLKLQEKFRLDLDDEEAIHFFQALINETVSALFTQKVGTIHRWAQYWQ